MIRVFIAKLKLYALVCVLAYGTLGEEERVEDQFSEMLTDRLISAIEKRLQDYDEPPSGNQQCDFRVETNTIIKTHVSLDAGAQFLDSIENLNSREECQQKCCESEFCNVAVFKEKEVHSCYMFDCGAVNKCNFTQHEEFSIMRLMGDALQEQEQSKHENDLAQLVTKPSPPPTTITASSTTTTATTPTTTTTTTPTSTVTTRPTKPKTLVKLFEECEQSEDCAGTGTECVAGFCICKPDYHAQEGVCRHDCTRFEFECANKGRPLAVPQCIATYDTCDGIQHCSDGSDEINCAPVTAKTQKDKGKNNGVDEAGEMEVQTAIPKTEDKPDDDKQGSDSPAADTSKPVNKESQEHTDSSSQVDGKVSEKQSLEKQEDKQEEEEQEEKKQDQKQDSEEKKGDDDKESSVQAAETGKESAEKEEKPSGKKDQEQEEEEHKEDGDDSHSESEGPGEKEEEEEADDDKPSSSSSGGGTREVVVLEMMEQQAAQAGPDSSSIMRYNQGAVIALGLGLAVTALLLMFVGCRLRTVKKRLRRGRPLSSGEADYLINGMYL